MRPGDIIFIRDEQYGHHRIWEIQGIYLGGEGEESLVEIRNFMEKPQILYGRRHDTTVVPEPLLRNLRIYRAAVEGSDDA